MHLDNYKYNAVGRVNINWNRIYHPPDHPEQKQILLRKYHRNQVKKTDSIHQPNS